VSPGPLHGREQASRGILCLLWPAAAGLLALAFAACGKVDGERDAVFSTDGSKREMIEKTPLPRIAMFWTPIREDDSLWGVARHDLVVTSADWLGLEPDREPPGLADGFTPPSAEAARRKLEEVRRLNSDIIVLCEVNFYEYHDDWLPEDHEWWLQVDGEREQFWPGTHRMDWFDAGYRAHVVRQTLALREAGVDGVYYDNLRDEPRPWISLLQQVRRSATHRPAGGACATPSSWATTSTSSPTTRSTVTTGTRSTT
jgi:hypothetical protein